jgi:GTP cyclohydrolase I
MTAKTPEQIAEFRQHMLECEARDWLRDGYTTPERVASLMELITKKRGVAAAQALKEEMRRQWTRRQEWMK